MSGEPYGNDAYGNQQYWRRRAKEDTARFGFKEGELQLLWRGFDCFKRKYDTGEVVAAICDALTREGQTAWPGDGTSCVEQMIRLQWERAEKAESELSSLKEEMLTTYEAETILRELLGKPNKGPEFDERFDARERAVIKLRALSTRGTAEK